MLFIKLYDSFTICIVLILNYIYNIGIIYIYNIGIIYIYNIGKI